MLNKEVCKKCWKGEWDAAQDNLWKLGEVECRSYRNFVFIKNRYSHDKIPEDCEYATEHIVKAGRPVEFQTAEDIRYTMGVDTASANSKSWTYFCIRNENGTWRVICS